MSGLVQFPVLFQGIEVIGRPVMNCFAIKSADPSLRILVVADEMEKKGKAFYSYGKTCSVKKVVSDFLQVNYFSLA